jgi:inositol-phosphate phosphatase/L-galactose 1-phosphate phosphatase
MSELHTYLKVAVDVAREAGRLIQHAFSEAKNVHYKGSTDLVTDTDRQCEKLIHDTLSKAFPSHKFIGEEETSASGAKPFLYDAPTWMVDPLDGTTNFVHGYPFVCVSLGLAIKKEVVVGVVFNPILNELFTAVKGGGAFLNGQRISCSQQNDLRKALVATEIGTTRDAETMAAVFERVRRVTEAARSLRCCGSCAMNLCGVACGRLDAFYEINFGGCWDVAAGSLILQEAGGKVQDPCGKPFDVMSRRVLGSNAHVGEAMAAVLVQCTTSPAEPAAPTLYLDEY